MSEKWYIDSIDARGGRAFATLRLPDLADKAPLQDGLTAFISAPHFEPEFLNRRSLALSLGRGYGQVGLFTKEGEVPFDSLEAVTEFVRRAYLAGGSGDGPAEGGAEGTAPPPTGEVPPPDITFESFRSKEGVDPAQLQLSFAHEMRKHSARLPLEKSYELAALYVESQTGPSQATSVLTADSILDAATLLITDALRRNPSWNDLKTRIIFARLYRSFAKLGIIHLLYGNQSFRQWIKNQLSQRGHPHPASHFEELVYWRGSFHGTARECDPFEDLAFISIPAVTYGGQSLETLQGLLAALISDPANILNPVQGTEVAKFGLFAASYLCLGSDSSPDWFYWDETALSREFLGEAGKKGLVWLSANFPKRVFAKQIEEMISSASRLHRANSGHAPSTKTTGGNSGRSTRNSGGKSGIAGHG